MKKNYFLVLSLISTFSFSQQVLKRITDTPTQTIVELFVLRNGTSLPNTTGNSNFDSGTSDSTGNVIVYNPSLSNTYTKQQLPNGLSTHGNEQLGDGIFIFDSYALLNNQNFVANGGSGATLSLIIPQEDGNADSIQDNNSLTDLFYTKLYLPKTLTDGNPIPNGLMAKCQSRKADDFSTGATMPPRQSILFTFNGTNWLPTSYDWLGNLMPTLQEINNEGQLLNVNLFTDNSKINIYPNPANNIITIKSKENINGYFLYSIIDLTGKIVKSGNSKFNDETNIEELTSGNYIIQVREENGKIFNLKIIKN